MDATKKRLSMETRILLLERVFRDHFLPVLTEQKSDPVHPPPCGSGFVDSTPSAKALGSGISTEGRAA
ncbi:MAG TPA: hypothetical protein VIL85_24940 [Thermomicrobiales bacterium]|jgi:hypothetical protein